MKKILLPAFFAVLFVLVGAGCASPSPSATTQTSTATREQQAYVYCTSKGYTPKIRFDSEVNRNRLFCMFENGRECDAIQYLDKKCDPKKIEVEEDINSSLTPPELRFNCEPKAKPVCTTEGKTYTNRCIAEAQGQKVRYEGVCTEKDEPFVLETPPEEVKKPGSSSNSGSSVQRSASWPATPSRTVSDSEKATPQPVPNGTPSSADASTPPEWVPNLISLLSSSASPYKMTLSECKSGGTTYYYQKEDCPSCFRILYKSTGESACYPGLDDSQCPVWNEKSCKIIWQK